MTAEPSLSLRPRSRVLATAGVILAYLVIAWLMAAVWFAYPAVLEMGRDARLANWLAKVSLEWGSSLSLTTINPFQGMASMLLPINAVWIPGAWPLAACDTLSCRVVSELVYFTELFVAVLLLARVAGTGLVAAVSASLLSCLLLFPPFNFFFGLQAWIGTAPIYGHTVAVVCLMYATTLLIGRARIASLPLTITLNAALIAVLLVLLWLLIIATPFWNAGMLIGAGVGMTIIGLGSTTWRAFVLRAAAGVVLLAVAYGSGLLEFLASFKDISARFAEVVAAPASGPSAPPPPFQFPSRAALLDGLCAMGISCGTPQPWWPTGMMPQLSLHAVIVVGCAAAAWLTRSPPLRRLALVAGIAWALLLLYWLGLALGIAPATQFAPLYTFLPLYPLLALGIIAGVAAVAARVRIPAGPAWLAAAPAAALAFVLALGADGQALALLRGDLAALERQDGVVPMLLRPVPSNPDMLDVLADEIALAPGAPFRGSVVSAFGAPGGPMLASYGLTGNDREPYRQFDQYMEIVNGALGNTMSLLDLWERDIPTLEEYGQAITVALKLYEQAFFARPLQSEDGTLGHFVFVRTLNIPILESLGVRFVLTDAPISGADATLSSSIELRPGIPLNLYELRRPNLGSYSPVELRSARSAAEVIAALHDDPRLLEHMAFVDEPLTDELMPAGRTTFSFVRRGAILSATSAGRSAVLLPLQFSRCLAWTASGPGRVDAVIRANLLHALVVFSGDVDIRFHWTFGIPGDTACRRQDVEDLDRLGVPAAYRAALAAHR